MKTSPLNFNLKSFEGPLDLLAHLVENKELEVFEVALEEVTSQYLGYLSTLLEHDLDLSAEFLSLVSSLMLLKSRMLLPKHNEDEVLDEASLRLDIIEQLVHYYKFKNIAEEFRNKETHQQKHFNRGIPLLDRNAPTRLKKPSSQTLLSDLLIQALDRQKLHKTKSIEEESYRVRDMMELWKKELKEQTFLYFTQIFKETEPKLKLITLFLALLELLKNGEARVTQIEQDWKIERIHAHEK